jgi:hypothetical protein
VKTHILADEATAMHLCCPLLGSIRSTTLCFATLLLNGLPKEDIEMYITVYIALRSNRSSVMGVEII